MLKEVSMVENMQCNCHYNLLKEKSGLPDKFITHNRNCPLCKQADSECIQTNKDHANKKKQINKKG
jgi:hypothetical protein